MNRLNGIPTIGVPKVEIGVDSDLAGLDPPIAMIAQILRRIELVTVALEEAGHLPRYEGSDGEPITEQNALAKLQSWKHLFPTVFPGESIEHAATSIRQATAKGHRIRSIRARAIGHVHIELHDS